MKKWIALLVLSVLLMLPAVTGVIYLFVGMISTCPAIIVFFIVALSGIAAACAGLCLFGYSLDMLGREKYRRKAQSLSEEET